MDEIFKSGEFRDGLKDALIGRIVQRRRIDRYFFARDLINIADRFACTMREIYLNHLESRNQYLDRILIQHPKLGKEQEQAPKQHVFTPKEAQAIAGIKSKDTINKYLNQGKIIGKKDAGGHWRILRADLAQYVGHDNF